MSSPEHEKGCAPFTNPAGKECTLPSGARSFPSSPPNVVAQDRAIEARYGAPTSPASQMKTTDLNSRFSGPGH